VKGKEWHFDGECDEEADSDDVLLYAIELAVHKNVIACTSS
jgi:hypothetical protein